MSLSQFPVQVLLICIVTFTHSSAQGDYTSWILGDTSDAVVTGYQSGLVLAGGGGDNDNAMQWMLERADGGDVLVLRTSGSDGYNDYFYNQLDVAINSVETIRFDGPGAAYDDYVLRRIEEAEVLFLAGGDQYLYYQYWQNTPVADKINGLLNVKQATVGGTSAGMMVLSDAYYVPSGSGVTSAQALNNPFHPNMDILGKGDFIDAHFLNHIITDTHFDQRNRAGRLMTFMARLVQQEAAVQYGIAANEFVAICIDENGIARVFGEYPSFSEDVVYFLQADCLEPFMPEVCDPDTPLQWYLDGYAVWAMVVPGNTSGDYTFDMNDFMSHTGGSWERWYVQNGVLTRLNTDEMPVCSSLSGYLKRFEVASNPGGEAEILWQFDPESQLVTICLEYSTTGTSWQEVVTFDFDKDRFTMPYTYLHTTDRQQINHYYRIKMTLPEGDSELSFIRHIVSRNNYEGIKAFPNPTESTLTIEISKGIYAKEVSLYDIMGRQIEQYQINFTNNLEIDISHLPKGQYFLKAAQLTPIPIVRY